MALLLDDREAVRPLLFRDPIRNSVVIHRMFHNPEFSLAFVDAIPDPRAVLALRPAQRADTPHQFAMHATDARAAADALRAVPKGGCIYHVADEFGSEAVRRGLRVGWWGEAILYLIRKEDFHERQTHAVQPLDEKWAPKIARIWAPDWPAEGYIRQRIRDGLNAAIYHNGEPIAWYMTHLETDDVVMLGFLHVEEEFRGRGFAKSLSVALIEQTLAKGKAPCCHVYTDNQASIRLMEGLGFRRVCLQAWGDGVAPA